MSEIGDRARCVVADLPTCNRTDATFDDDVEHVRALIRDANDDVVLVGNSYGGTVISAIEEPNLRALVYVAAFMLDETETLFGIVSNAPATDQEFAKFNDDGSSALIMDPEGDKLSYSALGFERLYRHEPRTWAYSAALASVEKPSWRTHPSTYIVATRDTVLAPAEQRRMAQRAATVIETDGDHMIHLEMPDRIADILLH